MVFNNAEIAIIMSRRVYRKPSPSQTNKDPSPTWRKRVRQRGVSQSNVERRLHQIDSRSSDHKLINKKRNSIIVSIFI